MTIITNVYVRDEKREEATRACLNEANLTNRKMDFVCSFHQGGRENERERERVRE